MSYSSTVLALSPTSYWRLNETSGTVAADSGSGGHAGTYVGSPTLNSDQLLTGDAAKAPVFSGVGQWVDCGNFYKFAGSTSFTVMGMCRPSSAANSIANNNYERIVGADWYNTSSDNGGWAVLLFNDANGNHIQFERNISGDAINSQIPVYNNQVTLAPGVLFHWAVSYDGGMMRLYINGLCVVLANDTNLVASPSGGTTTTFRIGAQGTGGNPFAGSISEVAVWSGTVLTGNQIQNCADASKNITITPSGSGALWQGVYVDSEENSPYTYTDSFNTLIAPSQAKVIHSFIDWGAKQFPNSAFLNHVRATNNADLMITWEPWLYSGGANQPSYKLTNITAGNFDSYITSFANTIKALNYTVYLRFAHEMNGNWYPWGCQSGNVLGNVPSDYVAAWRHVWNLFSTLGVTNVKWVWCPNNYGPSLPTFSSLYPGDAYVDYVGIDGYNSSNSGLTWMYGHDVFSQSYAMLQQMTAKKVVICEVGSIESVGAYSKASWFTQTMLTDVPYWNNIIGWVYFESNTGTTGSTLRIESSTASQNAYSAAVNNTTYSAPGPFPEILSISPTTITAGSGGFTLTVNGFGFDGGSVVRWNGVALTTTYVSATQLTATVPATNIASPASATITVLRASSGNAVSDPATFTATLPPTATLGSISPSSALVGSAGFTLTCTGNNFVAGCSVLWDGAALTTTYVSSAQVTATVPSGNLATPGTHSVTVQNPSASASNALTFGVVASAPVDPTQATQPRIPPPVPGSITARPLRPNLAQPPGTLAYFPVPGDSVHSIAAANCAKCGYGVDVDSFRADLLAVNRSVIYDWSSVPSAVLLYLPVKQ